MLNAMQKIHMLPEFSQNSCSMPAMRRARHRHTGQGNALAAHAAILGRCSAETRKHSWAHGPEK